MKKLALSVKRYNAPPPQKKKKKKNELTYRR